MLQGVCCKCGKILYGWALTQKEHCYCKECNQFLIIQDVDIKEVKKTEVEREEIIKKVCNKKT